MPTYAVDVTQLRAAAEEVRRAGRAADALAEHPGVVRGRAADSGSEELRDAAELLAARWDRAFDCLAADARHLVAALTTVLATYDAVEMQVSASFAGPAGHVGGDS